MRLDYFHTGKADSEIFSRERVVLEPLPWPGNPQKLLDDSNLGPYFFEVRDLRSGKALYSRGYSSIFSEWQTTPEAKGEYRTFSESLRFPLPAASVKISVQKRDGANRFREIWSTIINPQDQSIERVTAPAPAPVIAIAPNGPPALQVDLLFLGEGYTAGELEKCGRDVRRAADALFQYAPFRERRKDFSLRAICAPSSESGVSHPSRGTYRRTLFDSTFDVFGTARYALSFNNRAIRETAAYAPYEFLAIVMNDNAYGNGGIFGQFATVSIDDPRSLPAFVHEFGHHFAGLADEYFLGSVAYAPTVPTVEPWEPNITALFDPKNLKWKELVSASTPIPTPWPKKEYERRGERNRDRYLSSGPYAGKVGAFEGANYMEKGYYRSEQNCFMLTLSCGRFCAACRRAIDRTIDLYAPKPGQSH
ncbi:MAG: peptidase M64 [Acidobacteriaceae bacterium]|nr:peptidase M64 [Acidobacteriaceae bacterium]